MSGNKKNRRPWNRLSGGLWGGGGVLILFPLVDYLCRPKYWSLEFSVVSEAIGIFLIILGIMNYRRK